MVWKKDQVFTENLIFYVLTLLISQYSSKQSHQAFFEIGLQESLIPYGIRLNLTCKQVFSGICYIGKKGILCLSTLIFTLYSFQLCKYYFPAWEFMSLHISHDIVFLPYKVPVFLLQYLFSKNSMHTYMYGRWLCTFATYRFGF